MLLERTILLGQLKNWNCKFWFFHYYKSKDREIDQNDRETLELQVKVNNQPSDASQSKDLDILDEVGTLTIKLKQLVPNILADSESIESFPLISPFVACPGLVSLQVVYKTNTILAPAVYEDFLRLLEEDGFFLIRTLINHRVTNNPLLIKCLLSVYNCRGILSEFVRSMLSDYINNIQTFSEDLFREDSPCSLIIELYLRHVCQEYVVKILEPFLIMLDEEQRDCEVFPPFLQGNNKRQKQVENMKNLARYCSLLSSLIFSSIQVVPEKVRLLFAFMASCMRKKIPNWERTKQVSISSFFFLRLWNSAITSPSDYGILGKFGKDSNSRTVRTCVFLAKYLQTLASGATFHGKEEYMIPLMDVVQQNTPSMVSFLELLSQPSEYSQANFLVNNLRKNRLEFFSNNNNIGMPSKTTTTTTTTNHNSINQQTDSSLGENDNEYQYLTCLDPHPYYQESDESSKFSFLQNAENSLNSSYRSRETSNTTKYTYNYKFINQISEGHTSDESSDEKENLHNHPYNHKNSHHRQHHQQQQQQQQHQQQTHQPPERIDNLTKNIFVDLESYQEFSRPSLSSSTPYFPRQPNLPSVSLSSKSNLVRTSKITDLPPSQPHLQPQLLPNLHLSLSKMSKDEKQPPQPPQKKKKKKKKSTLR
eukprot:TRINITY_DN4027_c0_g2_i3.p1 TRINITY_DN4027_c0_g2~~TRINITY_DN4027_c0_g2_i3.p1  ORF type:complete len:650 (+),score=160.54 TRINITY_DN4027_c0_g2_i3:239-2188(+)